MSQRSARGRPPGCRRWPEALVEPTATLGSGPATSGQAPRRGVRPRFAAPDAPAPVGKGLWYHLNMGLFARPAALAALALALAPGAGPGRHLQHRLPGRRSGDQLEGRLRHRQRRFAAVGQRDRRGSGNARRRHCGRQGATAVARRRRLEHHARHAHGRPVRLPAPRARRQSQDAYIAGLRDGKRVVPGQKIGFSGFSGSASAKRPQLGFVYQPGGGEAVDPYELLASAAACRPRSARRRWRRAGCG